jgi:hypothetical protein
MIPPEAFTEIIKELERQPLQENSHRLNSGVGRSQAFGLTNRRCVPPDYCRNCWCRPLLYKHILDYAKEYVDISYNAITLNQNYQALPHKDKGNKGDSYLIAFGDYIGGDLVLHEGDLSGNHNIRYKSITTDFSKVLHSVNDFTGNRYSLVFYTLKYDIPESVPPPSVRLVNNKWYFFRGEEKITRKDGIPHPLKKVKESKIPKLSGIIKEITNLTITFD